MATDERFSVPLYSAAEVARYLDVPVSTFRTWVHGYERRPEGRQPVVGDPIVTTLARDAGASVPFVGLAEAHALAAIRRAGVPLQRIRPALELLQEELGIEHVLASKALYTDGAEVLYDYAQSHGDTQRRVVRASWWSFAGASAFSTKWSSPTCEAWSSRLMINGPS